MAKLYILGIGGTGSRVIKSLVMLLAAGIDTPDYEIVPILIDPDSANGDVTRTVQLLRNYQQVHRMLDHSHHAVNRFFRTPLRDLYDGFRLELAGTRDDDFKGYIDYNELDRNNKALINVLFSRDNLNAKMEVGFKGNPNIGSVVLNQLTASPGYEEFASSFQEGDRIFIVSSIFGGTGAAGFPLLLKNLRNNDSYLTNRSLLQNAPIGAITVLPYFGVKPSDSSEIEKSTFISKTKAALSYYTRSISGNKSLNALYYIGDDVRRDYENVEGAVKQKNDAHFVELAGALAIIDFLGMDEKYLTVNAGKAENPQYKEFGIRTDTKTITFSDLGLRTRELIRRPLVQYLLFCKYMEQQIEKSLDMPWATGTLKIDRSFLSQPFYSGYLKGVNAAFMDWLRELSGNTRSFAPFHLEVGPDNLFEMLKDIRPASRIFRKGKNYGRFDYVLSQNELNASNNSTEQKFMDLFYVSTLELAKEKFKI